MDHMGAINKFIFGIHGGGNIGLGCMADIISRSELDYHIFATSSDDFFNRLINTGNQFWLQHQTEQNIETTLVKDITMIHSRKRENIIWLYKHANMLAICLTEKALSAVAHDIAIGLMTRYEMDKMELKILVLMNKTNCNKLVRRAIEHEILLICNDINYTEKVLSTVYFIPTVVDRIVSKIDKKAVIVQLQKQLIMHTHSEINGLLDLFDPLLKTDSLQKNIELILSNPEYLVKAIKKFNLRFNLFHAERHFSLSVPDNLPEAQYLPNVKSRNNLLQFSEIKNKYINAPHAMLAWMGGLMGCKTIAEAINNPSMLWFMNNLMEREIAPILKAEYPFISNHEFLYLKNVFINRCKCSFQDPIIRVGRDPLRKLNNGGRIRGIIELKQKHNLNIPIPELEKGMAAGILYAIKKIDPHNEDCQKINKIYRNNSSYRDILCYNGPCDSGMYSGLDPTKDKLLINNILKRISTFEKFEKAIERIKS